MKYYNYITGSMPPAMFFAAMTFAFLGFGIYKWITAKKRDVKSSRTPAKWDWEFWFKDNIHEAVIGLVKMFVVVRFAPDLLRYFAPEQVEFFEHADGMLVFIVLGFALTWLVNQIKKRFVR